jgi:thioesterase domain-containing protein
MHDGSGNNDLSADEEELLALLMEEEERPQPSPQLVPLQPQGGKPPLFFVGFTHYRTLAEHMPTDRPFYGMLTRDLESDTYEDRIETMAREHVRDILTVQPSGPYHLGGFCFGGLVAYEMTRIFEAKGEKVAFLGLVDTRPPSSWRAISVPFRERLLNRINVVRSGSTATFGKWARQRAYYEWERVREGVKRVTGKMFLQVTGSVPIPLRGAVRADHDMKAAHAYNRRGRITAPLTLFESHGMTSRRGIGKGAQRRGWKGYTHGDVCRVRIPGAHGEAFEEPHVQVLARRIDKHLL